MKVSMRVCWLAVQVGVNITIPEIKQNVKKRNMVGRGRDSELDGRMKTVHVVGEVDEVVLTVLPQHDDVVNEPLPQFVGDGNGRCGQ
jgi:hypothetical protein